MGGKKTWKGVILGLGLSNRLWEMSCGAVRCARLEIGLLVGIVE